MEDTLAAFKDLTEAELNHIVQFSNTWSLAHGMVYRVGQDMPDVVTYVPHTLFPSMVPRHLFEKAQALQPKFNELMWKVARDEEFLTSSLKR